MELEDLRAKDVMTRDVVSVPPTMPVRDLLALFREGRITGVPVVDEDLRPLGVISETDVLRALAYTTQRRPPSGAFPTQFTGYSGGASVLSALADDEHGTGEALKTLLSRMVRDLMTPVVFSCSEDDSLGSVCETMSWK